MPIEVTMPRLSDTMQQGTVVKWNVKEGDPVKPGTILADIETDKATMELESFDEGTVATLAAKEGDNVGIGEVIVVLAGKGEDAAKVKASFGGKKSSTAEGAEKKGSGGEKKAGAEVASSNGKASSNGAATAVVDDDSGEDSHGSGSGGRIFASPLAKKVAEEMGVDLAEVKGTGPSGRIVRADVEAAAKSPAAASPSKADRGAPAPSMPPVGAKLEAKSVALSNMRRTIAVRLVESKTTIPHYQVTMAVDMDPLLTLRTQLNEQLKAQGVKLSVNDFLVRACALAMHQHPHINASWKQTKDAASIELKDRVNIGVAISLPMERGGGLVVGVLRDADHAGLRQLSAETKRLADKARAKGLSVEEMDGSTFTISNLGMYGVEHFTAIINPPNSAILAVGAAVEKPVVRNGQIVVGHEMQMTMSSDHRVIDGAMAAEYLQTVKRMLEAPATLLV
ncbi:MAG: 2-oxo acid dehydrogenase subunit E2 [Phycisphaeraceae bacterium]|nr:2-oxo acid dehydrogenase subunit E2 [Phycisphaeraceae bacterium]